MNQRLSRLADQIQRTLATLIRDDINDPRLTGMVTISAVKVSRDLGYADIYVTILEPTGDGGMHENTHAQSLDVLKKASGFLRSELSRRLATRTTPRLRFHYDNITAQGNHMMALIAEGVRRSDINSDDIDNDNDNDHKDGSA